MNIQQMVHENAEKVIEIRRDIHRHPELAMQEFRTTEKVMEILKENGISCRALNPTGVIADIHGKKPGKTVALRADMDALPLTEKTDVAFKSVYDGRMHACGHDTHTAMLLGAAMILHQIRDQFEGTVRLIFQPGEETGSGAKAVIAQGGVENVDMMFGIHIICPMPKGMIQCSKGASHASSDVFRITVQGAASHAASPHMGADALLCAAQMVMNLQTVISRELDPMEPAVITVGTLHAGTVENIIAGTAEMTGTVRTTSLETHRRMPELLQRHAEGIARANGCTVDIEYQTVTEVVMNDPAVTEIGMRAARKIGADKVICKGLRTLGGEDFGAYTSLVPASFISVGGGGVGPMHGDCFNPDEDAFEIGTGLYVQCALEALKKGG